MAPLNPPCRLHSPPTNGCLSRTDGEQFSALLQCGRMATSTVSNSYPHLHTPSSITNLYTQKTGQLILAHLSAQMYSYWDASPSGPSVFHITQESLIPALKQICIAECADWGCNRLVPPLSTLFYILFDTPSGSVVADAGMERFFLVLGLMHSPAAALLRSGVRLPARVRLTALPYKGVLVYDGLLNGMPEKVEMREAARLRMRYEKMRDEGNVVTGLHLKRGAGVDVSGLSDMELRVFISARGGEVEDAWGRDVLETRARAMGHLSDEIGTRMLTDRERAAIAKMKSVEKSETMVVFRRVGYTETDNPNHAVCVMNGAQACGMFMTTALVPSKMEVLEELEKFAATRNRLPAMIALDDERLALEVNVVSKQAGVQAGFYPVPSVEEQHLLASVPPKVLEDLKKVGSGGQGRAGVSA